MSLRWIAAVIVFAGAAGFAGAKPPDLPVKPEVTCSLPETHTAGCETLLPHEPLYGDSIRRCVAGGCECCDNCSCATKCECKEKGNKCGAGCSCAAACKCNDGCKCGEGCKCGAEQCCSPDCKCGQCAAGGCDCNEKCQCKDQCKCGEGNKCSDECNCNSCSYGAGCDCNAKCQCKDQCKCGEGSKCSDECNCNSCSYGAGCDCNAKCQCKDQCKCGAGSKCSDECNCNSCSYGAGCDCNAKCQCKDQCKCGAGSKCSDECSCSPCSYGAGCDCNDKCQCKDECKCDTAGKCSDECSCSSCVDGGCVCCEQCSCKDGCKCVEGTKCANECPCGPCVGAGCGCSDQCSCAEQCSCGANNKCSDDCPCSSTRISNGSCGLVLAIHCCPPMHLVSFNPALRTATVQAITPCVQRTARKCKEWLVEARGRQFECPQPGIEPLDEEVQEVLEEPTEVEVIGFMPQEWPEGEGEEAEEAPMPRSVKHGCPFLQWKAAVKFEKNCEKVSACGKARKAKNECGKGCKAVSECGKARTCKVESACGKARKAVSACGKACKAKSACDDACKASKGCSECCETPCQGCTEDKPAKKNGKSECLEAKILHNINQLIKAQHLIAKAELLRQAGDYDHATRCYEKVKKLCPGSRLDTLACRRIDEMVEEKAAAEEAEPFPVPQYNDPKPCHPQSSEDWGCVPIAVEVKVAEALEACQRMVAAGCFAEALTMARHALDLDPACCPARVLITKIQVLLGIEEPEPEIIAPVEPDFEPSEALDPCAVLRPCLPPLPCNIVPVLAEILRIVGEPKVVQVIVTGEEPCEGPCQMPADWKLLGLYVDEAGDLELSEDGEEQSHQKDVVKALVDYFQECGYVEIDLNRHDPRVWVQLGVIHCNWTSGGGHVSVCLGLAPATAAEPRDQQSEFYQEVIDWIESMNCGDAAETVETGLMGQAVYYPDEDFEVIIDD